MRRKTSIECYRDIKESGVLSEIRLKVLKGVSEVEPCTSGELENHMNKYYDIKGSWKALSWLREANLLKEAGKRPCHINGRKKIIWELSGEEYTPVIRDEKPYNLDKCIEFIISKMEEDGIILANELFLRGLKIR